jgi:hypothetical protein
MLDLGPARWKIGEGGGHRRGMELTMALRDYPTQVEVFPICYAT